MRTCKQCGLIATDTKELEAFVKSTPSKYGRMNICKLCMCVIRKEKYNQKEYIREYRKINKDVLKPKMVKWAANWHAANKDKRSHTEAVRRARKNGSSHTISSEEKKHIRILYRVSKVMSKLGQRTYHVDHIIALSKGGKHILDNLQIIDSKFNLSKKDRIDIGRMYKNQIRKDIL